MHQAAHHEFLESRHPEVTKNLYYVFSTCRSQIPIFLGPSSWTKWVSTIHATRCGNLDPYLECVRSIIPYAFAYDHLNYAKYLTPMLVELLNLPTNYPLIYEQFMLGSF